MWLLTVVGPVHGQRQFTFALEQSRTYSIGRDKNSDIHIDSRRLRGAEGKIEVGRWNPDQHLTAPHLVYMSEPKKSKAPSPVKVLLLRDPSSDVNERDSYDPATEPGDSAITLGGGKAIDYGDEVWFYVEWSPLHFTNDKMKECTEDHKQLLRKYCVSWNESFDQDDLPDVVVSKLFTNTQACNYAMCFGIPIATPEWQEQLAIKLNVCWKKNADSQDSFQVPSPEGEDVRPQLDPAMKTRQSLEYWLPDPARRRMWSNWHVLELKKPKGALLDDRYYKAMGATLEEIDVLTNMVKTPEAFLERISPSYNCAIAEGRNVIVVHLLPTKTAMSGEGVDFNAVVVETCQKRGIACAPGSILWNAMAFGGVEAYLDKANSKAISTQVEEPTPPLSAPEPASDPPVAPAAVANPAAHIEPAAPTGRLTRRAAGSRSVSRAPSVPPSAPVLDPSPSADDTASPTPGPSTAAPKKPLKRRAGRAPQRVDMDIDEDIAAPTPLSSQPSRIPETQLSEQGPSLASRVPDSMEMDTQHSHQPSQANSVFPSQNAPARSSRLKRRAGLAPAPSSFLDGLDTSVQYEDELKKQETANEIRELYEQSKRESASLASMPPTKRQRREGPEEIAEEPEEVPSRNDPMEIDEENDFVTRALRSARVKKESASPAKRTKSPEKAAKPPPKKVLTTAQARRARDATSEEDEPIEQPKGRAKSKSAPKAAASPVKRGPKANQMTKDEAFLQAITKASRKNKEMEQLDKEFNELRIPKANNKKGTDPAVRANHISDDGPNYGLLHDFDDEMRGNFIEVVRRDLFRKDVPKVPHIVEDGRPNFKKFKKKNVVRREPLRISLAAPNVHNAEMGERKWDQAPKLTSAYWATEDVATQRTEPSQSSYPRAATSFEDEDEVPLVPQSRRKLLSQIQEEGDDDDVAAVPSTRGRRVKTPASASTSRRSTRASSVQSEASSTAAPPPTRTQRATTQRTQRATAKRGTQRVLLEESDDDEVFATAPAPPATGRSSRSTRSRNTQAPASSTLAAPSTRTRTSQRTQGTQRRKLLVDDDDDDEVLFMGVQKKRRLG